MSHSFKKMGYLRTVLMKEILIIFFRDTTYWLVLSVHLSAFLKAGAARSETAREKRGNSFLSMQQNQRNNQHGPVLEKALEIGVRKIIARLWVFWAWEEVTEMYKDTTGVLDTWHMENMSFQEKLSGWKLWLGHFFLNSELVDIMMTIFINIPCTI